MTNVKRQEIFDKYVEDYDGKAVEKNVLFDVHRFVSVEKDVVTSSVYVKGHKSLRGACNYLARTIEEGERFTPERILDLDNDELHELDLFVHVAPRHLRAVSVLFPRATAEGLTTLLERWLNLPIAEQGVALFKQAMTRRS